MVVVSRRTPVLCFSHIKFYRHFLLTVTVTANAIVALVLGSYPFVDYALPIGTHWGVTLLSVMHFRSERMLTVKIAHCILRAVLCSVAKRDHIPFILDPSKPIPPPIHSKQ